MSIQVIDTLNPLGNFPIAKAENIDVSGTALNTVLAGKANTADISTLTANKVDKVSGKGLSTNDYTNSDKSKVDTLSGIFSIVD